MKVECFINRLTGRTVALIMSLVMVLTIIPISVSAEDDGVSETTVTSTEDVEVTGTSSSSTTNSGSENSSETSSETVSYAYNYYCTINVKYGNESDACCVSSNDAALSVTAAKYTYTTSTKDSTGSVSSVNYSVSFENKDNEKQITLAEKVKDNNGKKETEAGVYTLTLSTNESIPNGATNKKITLTYSIGGSKYTCVTDAKLVLDLSNVSTDQNASSDVAGTISLTKTRYISLTDEDGNDVGSADIKLTVNNVVYDDKKNPSKGDYKCENLPFDETNNAFSFQIVSDSDVFTYEYKSSNGLYVEKGENLSDVLSFDEDGIAYVSDVKVNTDNAFHTLDIKKGQSASIFDGTGIEDVNKASKGDKNELYSLATDGTLSIKEGYTGVVTINVTYTTSDKTEKSFIRKVYVYDTLSVTDGASDMNWGSESDPIIVEASEFNSNSEYTRKINIVSGHRNSEIEITADKTNDYQGKETPDTFSFGNYNYRGTEYNWKVSLEKDSNNVYKIYNSGYTYKDCWEHTKTKSSSAQAGYVIFTVAEKYNDSVVNTSYLYVKFIKEEDNSNLVLFEGESSIQNGANIDLPYATSKTIALKDTSGSIDTSNTTYVSSNPSCVSVSSSGKIKADNYTKNGWNSATITSTIYYGKYKKCIRSYNVNVQRREQTNFNFNDTNPGVIETTDGTYTNTINSDVINDDEVIDEEKCISNKPIVYSFVPLDGYNNVILDTNNEAYDYIEVDSSTGEVTINHYGKFKIIASREASCDGMKDAETSYILQVNSVAWPYTLDFTNGSETKYLVTGVQSYENPVKIELPEGYTNKGTYTYSITKTGGPDYNWCSIDSDGTVSIDSRIASNTYDLSNLSFTVTVYRNDDGIYSQSQSASYTVKFTSLEVDSSMYSLTGDIHNGWYQSQVAIKGVEVSNDESYQVTSDVKVDNLNDKWTENTVIANLAGANNYTFYVKKNKKDASDNGAIGYVTETIKIDTENPTGSVKVTSKDSSDKDVSYDFTGLPSITGTTYIKHAASFVVTADDTQSGIDKNDASSIQCFITDASKEYTETDLRNGSFNWMDYTNSNLLTDHLDMTKAAVYFKVTDVSGRSTYFSTNGLVCDSTAPAVTINLPSTSCTDANGLPLYDGDVKATLDITEEVSGIDTITYSIDGGAYKELKYNGEAHPSFTISAKDYNKNDVEIRVIVTDKSGNVSNAKLSAKTISIDTTKPTVEVSYDNNNVVNSKYFTSTRKATIKVTERNFNADDIVAKITNEDGKAPKLSSWVKHSGTGNGDNTYYTATVTYKTDGKYGFGISYTDLAGNKADAANYGDSAAATSFIVDTIDPVIQVSYDNNVVNNGTYYQDSRTATITITEHNFNSQNVNVNLKGDGAAISKWTTDGDEHTATVTFPGDGEYSWTASYTDEAGRKSNTIDEAEFTIDSVDPEVAVTDANGNAVKTNTAYVDDKITFTVAATDDYFEDLDVSVSGVAYDSEAGFVNKSVDQKVVSQNATSKSVAISNVESDGIYTLSYKATDKSGRTKTDEIAFSVNRHGSVFMLGDYAKTIQDTYVQNVTDEIEIIEINANAVEEHQVTVDDRTLTEGSEYQVTKSSDTGWNKYTYSVDPSVFEEEGTHSVRTSSTDSNETSRYSDIDGVEYSFVVDKTAPTMTYGLVNDNQTYKGTSKDASVMVKDDGGMLSSFKVELQNQDGEVLDTLYEGAGDELLETLENKENVISLTIPEGTALKLVATATDAAGNVATKEVAGLTVTTNNMRIWFANKPVFYASVGGAGAVVLIVIISAIAVTGKKKKKTAESK